MFKGQCVNSFLKYHLCIHCDLGRGGGCAHLVQKEDMALKDRLSPLFSHPITKHKLVSLG